jgi:hypothetical protein
MWCVGVSYLLSFWFLYQFELVASSARPVVSCGSEGYAQ